MNTNKPASDQEILEQLRAPITDLIEKHCPHQLPYEKLRLKQLAWQAVDVLARKENINVAQLDQEPEMKRIINDIRKIGASEEFIEGSLALAVVIFQRMQFDYPELLKKYKQS